MIFFTGSHLPSTFTHRHIRRIVLSDDLRGFWKPDKQARALLKKRRGKRPKLKPKVKRVKGKSRHSKLCNMPSELFYWTREWRALRQKVLEAYGYRCMLCRSVDEIQVDHIQPRSKAPHLSLAFKNLQVLCKDCNSEKSNIHADDYRDKAVSEDLDIELMIESKKWL